MERWQPGRAGLLPLAIVTAVMAALYLGREIFVPLALAILLSFALAPLVRLLRRLRLPRIPAVGVAVGFAFLLISAFAVIVAGQMADLAGDLPRYQYTIEQKIKSVKESFPGKGVVERASQMMHELGRQIAEPAEGEGGTERPPWAREEEQKPVPVEIRRSDSAPLETLQTVIGPVVDPLATAGIVVVFVIFMLLQQEDLRDRIIRLAGPRDLHRTTEALDDAGQRVGHYLLMQLVVNATYGIPVAFGLWLIGVPNPVLWGLLAIVLRFIPYIGPFIAAGFPVALSVAVDPGWTMLMWTAAMFIVIETISNNFIEPWLYGSGTGLSPFAVIVAAIIWTWLWGPVGLLLSTPLTVCLVVIGRHVPQLGFLGVLFGSEPVLTPAENLYQRLLADDAEEATERADDYLARRPLSAFYEDVAVPALALAERDRARGALDDEHRTVVAEGAMALVENLAEHEDAPPEEVAEGEPPDGKARNGTTGAEEPPPRPLPAPITPSPEWDDAPVLCVAARGNLDNAPAAMLAQLVERCGIGARVVPFGTVQPSAIARLEVQGVRMVCLSYMNADSLAHARYLIRRLRRRLPDVPVLVGLWTMTPAEARRDPLAATGADMVATSLVDAVEKVVATATGKTVEAEQGPTPRVRAAAEA